MSSKIFEEAIADAKKLKEVAEDNAKKAILEAVTPRIREFIEDQLLEADAEEAKSDAQAEMDKAFKVSAEANKEARMIALKMVNITTLHDKALRDAKKAMIVMKKKIATTQAQAAVAKEAAAEAEARADQVENAAKADAAESPTSTRRGDDAIGPTENLDKTLRIS